MITAAWDPLNEVKKFQAYCRAAIAWRAGEEII
jgi:hypothetical protein